MTHFTAQGIGHKSAFRFARAGFRANSLVWRILLFFSSMRPGAYILANGCAHILDVDDYLSVLAYRGQYERELHTWMTRFLGRGAVVVDVGAHSGVTTSVMARIVGPEGHVFSFEPDQALLIPLTQVAKYYGDMVTVEGKAVGETCCRKQFYKSKVPGNLGLRSLVSNANTDSGAFDEVDVVSLDEYFADTSNTISLLKIDVEGTEDQVLAGARRLIEDGRLQTVVMEVSPAFTQLSRFQEFLDNLSCPWRLFSMEEVGVLRRRLKMTEMKRIDLSSVCIQTNVLLKFGEDL